jgi:hypothetical protein
VLEGLLHPHHSIRYVQAGLIIALRREANRYFRNRKRQYLEDKINELARNSKNKNIRDVYRGINDLKVATNREIT